MGPAALIKGLIQSSLASIKRIGDDLTAEKPIRIGPYRDLRVESAFSTEHLLSDQGCLFAGHIGSPTYGVPAPTVGTPGTPVTFGLPNVAAVFGNASNILAIFNSHPISSGKKIYPRKIQIVTAEATVPTGTTQVMWGFVVDPANRQPTANAGGPFVPQPTVGDIDAVSGARIYYCNAASGLTTPVAGADARSWYGYLKFAPKVAKDVYELQFGGIDPNGLFTQALTVAQKYVEKPPAIGIPPQQWGLIYLAIPVAAANNVTYEPFYEGIEY